MPADPDRVVASINEASFGPSADRRGGFAERLRKLIRLLSPPIDVVSADLGRNGAQTLWVLGIKLTNGHVVTLHAPIAVESDPFSDATCSELAGRLQKWLRAHPPLPGR